MLKVRFLGTGTSQGIPVVGSRHPVNFSKDPKDKRFRSSVLLSKNGKNLNIDCGPDFRQQMLAAGVETLEGIIFTHEHNDHVLGIDDTRSLSFHQHRAMDLFGLPRTLEEIKGRFPYAFAENRYPGAPVLNLHSLDLGEFDFADFHIQPLEIMHDQLPILGFLIDNKFAYITDASFIPKETFEKIKNVDVLVLNALRKKHTHHSHFTLEQAIAQSERIGAGETYFTHISLDMGFHAETDAELPPHMHLAWDGLEIEI